VGCPVNINYSIVIVVAVWAVLLTFIAVLLYCDGCVD